MGGGLPEYIEPLRLAEAAAVLRGRLRLSQCGRLCSDCGPQSGRADLVLQFGMDAERRPYLHLEASARLRLRCNRCLAEMNWPLSTQVKLGIVGSDSLAAQLPEPYEPLLVTAGPLALIELVEDELLLALPAVAMHRPGQCKAAVNSAGAFDGERESPFAVLASLKRRGD